MPFLIFDFWLWVSYWHFGGPKGALLARFLACQLRPCLAHPALPYKIRPIFAVRACNTPPTTMTGFFLCPYRHKYRQKSDINIDIHILLIFVIFSNNLIAAQKWIELRISKTIHLEKIIEKLTDIQRNPTQIDIWIQIVIKNDVGQIVLKIKKLM